MAQGLTELLGATHRLKIVPPGEIASALTEDVAVLMLTRSTHSHRPAARHGGLTKAAHDKGALTLWDLAHPPAHSRSISTQEAALRFRRGLVATNTSTAGLARRPSTEVVERWQGSADVNCSSAGCHDAPLAFDPTTGYAPGISVALPVGTPMLSLTALEAGLDLFADVELAPFAPQVRRALGDLGSSPWWSRNWQAAACPRLPAPGGGAR